MATQVQLRRGTTTQNNAFTGAVGELSVDTDLYVIRIHDGNTAGGAATLVNTTSAQTVLNKTFSTGAVWNGSAVPLGYGGTGSALTAVAGAVAYSSGSGLGLTLAGTSGQVLVSGGTNAPVWVNASSVTAGAAITATTASNIAGGSAGQLVIQSDTDLTTFITAGDSGTFLRSEGAGYAPSWATADVTIGSTSIDLGSSSTSLAGLDILAATGTSHWKLPSGTTLQRPASPSAGMVRYNSTITGFEGYAAGAWSSLGGVKSVDALTFIRAETSAGASNGELEFYVEDSAGTDTTKAMGITHTGVVIAGNLTVNGTTVTVNTASLDIEDNIIHMSSGNTGHTTDVGFLGHYEVSTTEYEEGLTKDQSASRWKLMTGILHSNVGATIDYTGASYDNLQVAQLYATGVEASGDITSPNFYSVSDERLKDNIVDSPYGLAEVMQLRSVAYDMNGKHEIGLLAQNVEQHMPEYVTTDADGTKKLDYAKMVSTLVKTVQEQQAQIEELKARLG
jgi:hypothetical protein